MTCRHFYNITHSLKLKDVLAALSQIIDPDFRTDIVSCGFVKDMNIDDALGEVSFWLELTTPACPVKDMGPSVLLGNICLMNRVSLSQSVEGMESNELLWTSSLRLPA